MLAAILVGFVAGGIPFLLTLHRIVIAISMAAVNHDDGSGDALDPSVWSVGAFPKGRGLVHAVRNRAFLLGPVDLWEGEWISLGASPIAAGDVEVWSYSVGLLVKLSAFLETLHWPAAAAMNLGVVGFPLWRSSFF